MDSIDLVPMRKTSVLSLYSFRKFEVGEGGGCECGIRLTGQEEKSWAGCQNEDGE